jgi:hypothetical protein
VGRTFDVTLAGDRRPRANATHRSSTLLGKDVVLREGIRVTSAARALLDMALKIPSRSLTRFVNEGRLRKLLTLADLADIAGRNPTHSGARLLMAHADNTQNPTRSGGEDDFQGFYACYDLPTPERQCAYIRSSRAGAGCSMGRLPRCPPTPASPSRPQATR